MKSERLLSFIQSQHYSSFLHLHIPIISCFSTRVTYFYVVLIGSNRQRLCLLLSFICIKSVWSLFKPLVNKSVLIEMDKVTRQQCLFLCLIELPHHIHAKTILKSCTNIRQPCSLCHYAHCPHIMHVNIFILFHNIPSFHPSILNSTSSVKMTFTDWLSSGQWDALASEWQHVWCYHHSVTMVIFVIFFPVSRLNLISYHITPLQFLGHHL